MIIRSALISIVVVATCWGARVSQDVVAQCFYDQLGTADAFYKLAVRVGYPKAIENECIYVETRTAPPVRLEAGFLHLGQDNTPQPFFCINGQDQLAPIDKVRVVVFRGGSRQQVSFLVERNLVLPLFEKLNYSKGFKFTNPEAKSSVCVEIVGSVLAMAVANKQDEN